MAGKGIFYRSNCSHQTKYENELEAYFNNCGEKEHAEIKKHIVQAKKNIKGWSKEQWDQSNNEFDLICISLSSFIDQQAHPSYTSVQHVIEKQFMWISKFWTPTKESYSGHAQFIQNSELKEVYNKYNPDLAEFIAQAIKTFAEKNL